MFKHKTADCLGCPVWDVLSDSGNLSTILNLTTAFAALHAVCIPAHFSSCGWTQLSVIRLRNLQVG